MCLEMSWFDEAHHDISSTLELEIVQSLNQEDLSSDNFPTTGNRRVKSGNAENAIH